MKRLASTELHGHNSLALESHAKRVFVLEKPTDFPLLESLHRPLLLGGGSNIVLAGDYPGDVVLNRSRGCQIIDATEKHTYVRAQSGHNWHQLVEWSLGQGLYGLENLALIPGSAGAAPIQNIGAYGVELAESLQLVEVWDRERQCLRMLKSSQCQLRYRDSIFKQCPERYWIVNITLKLSHKANLRLRYQGLKQQLEIMGIQTPTPEDVASAVITLRRAKLPDPEKLPNAGSFFKNPVVSAEQHQRLLAKHPRLPSWPLNDSRYKLPAGWLIEACGWKGKRLGGAGISPGHALVVVNYDQATGADILELATTIQDEVERRFDLRLEIEPRIVDGN